MVLGIFDVRQVQSYIFRSKRLQEIIGASKLVADIVEKAFEDAIEQYNDDANCSGKCEIAEKWIFEDNQKINSDNHVFNIVYNGGGNLVVLCTDKEAFNEVSKKVSVDLVNKTFGITVAAAAIEVNKKLSYKDNWDNLQKKIAKVKASSLPFSMQLALPITDNDRYNGLPLSKIDRRDAGKRKSKEDFLKQKKYDELRKIYESGKKYSKDCDDLETVFFAEKYARREEGNSNIAIMHIDGNGLGNAITELNKMGSEGNDFEKQIKRTREVSKAISNIFSDAHDAVKNLVLEYQKSNKENSRKQFMFKVIQDGDDFTYVTTPKIALDVARILLEKIEIISNEKFKELKTADANIDKLTACAGIVYVNEKFPFYKAYQIAEQCCESAKSRFKKASLVAGADAIHGYIDFEVVKSGFSYSLSETRKKNEKEYEIGLYRRPYCVDVNKGSKCIDEEHDIEILINAINDVSEHGVVKNPRSWNKELRDIHIMGESSMKLFKLHVQKFKATKYKAEEQKDYKYPDIYNEVTEDGKTRKISYYYDALDIVDLTNFDLYNLYEKGGKANEQGK